MRSKQKNYVYLLKNENIKLEDGGRAPYYVLDSEAATNNNHSGDTIEVNVVFSYDYHTGSGCRLICFGVRNYGLPTSFFLNLFPQL